MFATIIDLTRKIKDGDPGVSISPAKSMSKDGWNAHNLHIYSHAGTHMDAPSHFAINNRTIDSLPVDLFIGKAWVVEISIAEKSQLINVKDIAEVTTDFSPGDSLLLRTGWNQKFGTNAYRNDLPRISKGLAKWMVQNEVKMVGVEPPSVADVNNIEELTEIHTILLDGNVQIIEGLTNMHLLEKKAVTLIALPLKINGGDGAPARVIAGY